jgi:DNA-binding response OmpR family regulator
MSGQRSNYCRIVVTDDDPTLLAFVVTTLREDGHCVFAAYDADAACELCLALPELDLLITNTRLGTTSARQLIRAVRRRKPDLAILHLGDPLPDPDGLLSDVPNLRQPTDAEELLAAVRGLVARCART